MAGPKRRYTSELRLRQAEETRARVVKAAADLFARRGYSAATLPMIAELAGVSTETVQAYGPKAQLLRAAVEFATSGGDRHEEAVQREWTQHLLDASTPLETADKVTEMLAYSNDSASGVWLAFVEAARHDEGIADELQTFISSIRAQAEVMLNSWRERGWLRDDTPFDQLVDRAVMIGAVELFDRYVRLGGGSVKGYRDLVMGLFMTSVFRD